MHKICTEKEAKDWMDRMKKESIKQLKVTEKDIKSSWYHEIELSKLELTE